MHLGNYDSLRRGGVLKKRHQYPLQNMKCVFAIVRNRSSRFNMILCYRVPRFAESKGERKMKQGHKKFKWGKLKLLGD